MKKRILSIILAIAMLACMIPLGMVTAYAEDGIPEFLQGRTYISNNYNEHAMTLVFAEDSMTATVEGVGSVVFSAPDEISVDGVDDSYFEVFLNKGNTCCNIDFYNNETHGGINGEFYLDDDTFVGSYDDWQEFKELFTSFPESLQNKVFIGQSTSGSYPMLIEFSENTLTVSIKELDFSTVLTFTETGGWTRGGFANFFQRGQEYFSFQFYKQPEAESNYLLEDFEFQFYYNYNNKQVLISGFWNNFSVFHTHRAGTEYMTDGRAHWLACDNADGHCDLKTVEDYEIAFSSYEGPELKETLGYVDEEETAKNSMRMARQGKVNDGVVSKTDGRTIIGLTQDQLDKIGNKLVIVGSDDSDNNKQVSVNVDCAYTWFYNVDAQTGEAVKVEAANTTDLNGDPIAAFVIIDSALVNDTITGFGYYRVYNDTVSDSTLIGEALYKAPRTFKAVFDENGDQSLNFYFDCKDHSDEGTVFENGTDNYLFDGTKEDSTNWGYNDIRDSIKGIVIDKSVIKYKGLTDTSDMFYSMNNADSIVGAEYLDVSNVTVMGLMFSEFGDCSASLTQAPDISNWNTGNVTAMDFMFQNYGGCVESLNFILNLSGWNLSKVSGCDNVFAGCCQSGTWKVTIPAAAGEQLNDDTHWYVGDGTNPDSYIEPTDGKAFTVAS